MSQKQTSSASAGSKNPSHGDVSFIRATPTGAFSPLTPSPGREKPSSSGNPYPHPAVPSSGLSPRLTEGGGGAIGWSEKEEMLSRELEEAKVRVAQMEKTMRWWSDCTANWRDKWNKARNERNKAREENRQLRARLDAAIKECTTLKRRLQGRVPGEPDAGLKSPAVDVGSEQASEDGSKRDSMKTISGKDSSSSSDLSIPSAVLKSEKEKQEKDFNEKDTDDAESKTVEERLSFGPEPGTVSSPLCFSSKSSGLDSVTGIHDENANASAAISSEQVAQLQLQLDAAQKTIQTQTYEKDTLSRTIETLEVELSSLRVKCEEIKQSRQELLHQVSKMREDHQNELGRLTTDLEDENSKTTSMDRRLTELRRELERLQAENAAEWQKRERLETEKQTLERENRKLRTQVNDLEEQLQRKHQLAAASVDSDLRTLQFDLSEKNKELTELRHTHNKVRKTLSERLTELEHTKRRADQYEAEVKKLRGRVEELKRDLAAAEDEVDMQTNSVRRLQRSNDELQEQVDNLTLQVDHLQNRLRRGSQSLPKTRSSSLKSFNMEDSAELADSEDELEDT
ncbi:coiled-coil domain-containing protein 102B-like isoform X2 [Babylonia areolata]|uniref:coiled-coil domain-containing protein 102B-like isoform X2 n=1 Tax=Babylonia areolata TaxID=304850 RepID=UPI003FD32854